MTNKYEELKNKHQKQINDFPYMFAFSDKQLSEEMKRLGLDPSDTSKIVSVGGGGFIRKTDIKSYNDMWNSIRNEHQKCIDEDLTGDGYIKDMFLYELENHEYIITGDYEETLDALDLSFEDINNDPKLKHGLVSAKKEILDKEKEYEL